MFNLSIIIPCKNDPLIKRLLNCLSNQTFKDFEVIVVDSSDRQIIKPHEFPLNLKVVRADCWIGTARNIGVKHASGEIIAFLDADTIVPNDFAEKIIEIFNSHSSLVGLAVLIYPTKTNPFIDLIYRVQRFLIKFSFRYRRPRISGACCIYRKSIFKSRKFIDVVGDDIVFSSDIPKFGKVSYSDKLKAFEEPRRWDKGLKILKSFLYYIPSYIFLLLIMLNIHHLIIKG